MRSPPVRSSRPRPARDSAIDRRRRVGVRRSGRAVRHHDQPLAHAGDHRADQRQQPLLGVSQRRQLGLQPGLASTCSPFLGADGTFDTEALRAAIEVTFVAQEILVGNADYPTDAIGKNTRRFRQLGLGLHQPRRAAHVRSVSPTTPTAVVPGRAAWHRAR